MVRTTARLALVALFALSSACSGSVDFNITKPFSVVGAPAPGDFPVTVQAVDLSTEASGAWSHRDKIKSLDLASMEGIIQTATAASGVTASGQLWLRPDGATDATQDVVVGEWRDAALVAPQTLSLTMNAAAMDIVNGALRTNGRFSLVVKGSLAVPAGASPSTASMEGTVTLGMKLTYKVN